MRFNRVLIFGAGAVGGYFGSLLTKSGVNLTFVSRGNNLASMQEKGLTLKDADGGISNIKINAVEFPEGKYDLVILSVKSKDTKSACNVIKNHITHDGVVLSLQNGVDNIKTISTILPDSKIIAGVVFASLSVVSPALIAHKGKGTIIIGAINQHSKPAEQPLYELLKSAEIPATISTDIDADMWKKLVWNIIYNPLSALLYATCGELLNDSHTNEIMHKMAAEVVNAAKANGIKLPGNIIEKTFDLRPDLLDYKTSAMQDVEANRVPELEGIMGRVVQDHNLGIINAPYTETIYNLLKFRYDRWFHYYPRIAADVMVINNGRVLLIERKYPPFGWAIPGGMVNYGETIENAASRELYEETGIEIKHNDMFLLGIYSDPKRDPRGHTVSAIYIANSSIAPVAADDAKNAAYFHFDDLPVLAFDHAKIIDDYKDRYYKSS